MKYRLPAAATAVIAAASLGLSATATPVLAATKTSTSTATELIIGLRSAAQATATVRKLDADPDVRVLASDAAPELKAVTVAVPADQAADAMAELRANPDVAYVEPNAVVQADVISPNDPLYSKQWGLTTAKVPPAWNVTTGSSVVVAVVDTGVTSVSDIAGRVLSGYDFVNNDADPSDDEGHGTMVSSVIAATGNNATGGAGVCWKCQILPVKVLGADGSGTHDNIAKGIVYAVDHGAQIINMSLGGAQDSQLLETAVTYADDHGVVVIASAGNDGSTTRAYPAAIATTIAVAGSTQTDGRYSWSNYNSSADQWVDLAAPGSNIAEDQTGGFYSFDGTSSAAPVVSGVAALALSANPAATAAEVRSALESSADAVGSWVANGRVDAEGTIAAISDNTQQQPLVISDVAVSPKSPVKGTVTVTPTVTSNGGTVKSVKMAVTMPLGKTINVTAARAPWTMAFSSIGSTGTATIVVTASDTAGNTTTASTAVTVDNTPPSATVTMPSYVTGVTPITLDAPSDDTARMEVYVRGVKVGEVTTDPWTYEWDTTAVSGSASLKIVVTDVAGNSTTVARSTVVDNAGPKLTWNGPNIGAKTALRGTVEIKAGATDGTGVAAVDVLDADGNVLGTDTASPYSIAIDTTQFSGATTLTLRATDKLGLISTLDKTLLLDNLAPVVGAVSTSPVAPARGLIAITPDITDDTGIKTAKVVLALPTGRSVQLTATAAPYTVKWVSTGITGEISATVTATDFAGNVTTATSSFAVDNTAPSALWTLPTYVNGTQTIALTSPSDDTASMELLVKGKSVAQTTSAPWSIDWDTTGLTGAVGLSIKTTDTAGNSFSVAKTVIVDYAGPRLAVTSNAKIAAAANTQIKLSVSDLAGIASVEMVDANGQTLATSGTGPYTLTVDTSAMAKGNVTWTVTATDKLGNATTIQKTFTIA
ncbi:S8 family serine peptidase [Paractinoplanes durhamensis]|uniref:S8 family serine peptidase n=1 Tax=Paractinoplanes durhamensis TaxID=113563 RepID=UPI0019457072|nr:S8 family serine peptidase [Actinoplanes durhamensis]